MSIAFKKIRWKNFLSTGNNWTEFDLISHRSTLIVGQNGAGKSTLLDALSFALFGKPHRNINKPQLVNSINNKNCMVEVEFDIGKANFKIVRGLKPNVFEIWKNDQMINQSSHNKEYQKILEQNIIKLNHKSFHQIVVLGSSSFIPFMQLPGGHRRSVIEDLLDINVFSKMNILLKERIAKIKDDLREISHELEMTETKIKSQKKYIRDLSALKESHREEKEAKIAEYQEQIKELQEKVAEASAEVDKQRKPLEETLNRLHDKKQTILHAKGQLNQKIKTLVADVRFYEQNDVCPTCTQNISEEIKTKKVDEARLDAKNLQSQMKIAEENSIDVSTSIDETVARLDKIREIQSDMNTNIQTITVIQKSITSLEQDLVKILSGAKDIENAEEELNALVDHKNDMVEKKLKKSEDYSYDSVIAEMLKDTGIKTKVIKQYLPVINNLVNQYLQILDFFVHFDLDENFHETIRSRHRDEFSYDSFSEGEKQRIDLALLFTWRMVAKMKNSVATNLLILDETFDSSLDADGVENLMKILSTLDDDTNIFVISHKGEILDGKFERKVEFVKHKNFSHVK